MSSEDRFVVRRSPFMLAFQFVAALFFIGISVWAMNWKQPPLEPGQATFAWFVIAGGAVALVVLGFRAKAPKEMLAIDGDGLSWWKADRTILWAEIERLSLDTYRSVFYLHVKLAAASGGVGTDPAHPIEAFGSLLTGSDLSFRLSGSDAGLDEVREALERLAPGHVAILPERE